MNTVVALAVASMTAILAVPAEAPMIVAPEVLRKPSDFLQAIAATGATGAEVTVVAGATVILAIANVVPGITRTTTAGGIPWLPLVLVP